MHQDPQGARQEVSLPTTPAAAAFLAAHEHCTEQTRAGISANARSCPPLVLADHGGRAPEQSPARTPSQPCLQSPPAAPLGGYPHGHCHYPLCACAHENCFPGKCFQPGAASASAGLRSASWLWSGCPENTPCISCPGSGWVGAGSHAGPSVPGYSKDSDSRFLSRTPDLTQQSGGLAISEGAEGRAYQDTTHSSLPPLCSWRSGPEAPGGGH